MPVIDLKSQDLWNNITKVLNASDEHVCVLPMTTFIKPVRTITLLQTDTSITSTKMDCPPGSVDLTAPPPPAPDPAPEPDDKPEPDPDPEPELADPRIVPYAEMKDIVSSWAFDADINAAYNRNSELDVRGSAYGVIYHGTLTVGMDWRDNPAQSVIVKVDIETGKLLAHKRGSSRYYYSVKEVEGTKFEFVGQSASDTIDVATFDA